MVYRFGPFVLDVGARRLVREGAPVRVTPRAFDLLVALVAQRPRALSGDELRRTLWPGIWISGTSLAQLVTELRKALGDRAREPRYVRTVHRHGYAFCGEAADEPPAALGAGDAATGFRLVCGGRTIPLLEGENLIGRDAGARVSVPTSLTSRRHARIVVTGSQAMLEDLGSKNGTLLAGRRIGGPTPLSSGDEIGIGGEVLILRSVDAAAQTLTGAD